MQTNEEREKISKALKEYKIQDHYWLSNGGNLGWVIKHILNVESSKEALKKLAKLIEPEPHKEIVMCKDCSHFDDTPGRQFCELLDFGHSRNMEEGYCAWGDRL